MPIIVIVSSQPDRWIDFSKTLEKETDTLIDMVKTGAEAVDTARNKNPLAMLIDDDIQDIPGLDLVRQLLAVNAMIHLALASDLAEDQFHEKTEGLGLIMKLSPYPDVTEAHKLAERLHQLTGAV